MTIDDRCIHYRAGFKYQLQYDVCIATPIVPATPARVPFVVLDADGVLVIREGYAWDGTSGPVPDTHRNLRASLVHDALYQLMRAGQLDPRRYKPPADVLFRTLCIADGVPRPLAYGYYWALCGFGQRATDPRYERPLRHAPRRTRRPR